MKLRRKYRVLTALVALCGVLFTQLAIAAYICPGLTAGSVPRAMAAVESPMQSMPGCDQADPLNPALCQAHCQDETSSLAKTEMPAVSPAMVIVSSIPIPLEPFVSTSGRDAEPDSLLLRITSPPISIRHCCFRI